MCHYKFVKFHDVILVSEQVRLQTQPKASPTQYVLYTGTYDCFRKTVSREVRMMCKYGIKQ